MTRLRRWCPWLVGLMVSTVASAQDAARQEAVQIVSALLRDSNADSRERFLDTKVAESWFDDHTRQELLEELARLCGEFEGFEFSGAVPFGEAGARCLLVGPDDAVYSLAVEVEPAPPYRFVRMGPIGAPVGVRRGMTDDEIAEALYTFLQEKVDADEFSGSVLLARGDQTVFDEAYGLASQRFGVPNNVDTKFNLGSMNKMFTGVAICQLAERGKLAFDDKVGKHLPDYPHAEIADSVTIHQLLTHTSGMGSYWNDRFNATFVKIRTLDDLLPTFASDPLQFAPGDRFGYSNAGPVVLGLIIESITGQSYYEYVRENIYEPAGMTNTDCYEMDVPVPNLAIGYTRHTAMGTVVDGPRRNNLFVHSVRGGPAGGGYSTAPDLLRFATALRNHTLLSKEMSKRLLSGKVEMGPGFEYAYLFGDHREDGLRYVGHNGGAPGISAEFSWYPETDVVLVVLSNYDQGASATAAFVREMLAWAER